MSLHPRGERTPKILALLLVLIAAIAFIPSIANAQKAPKKLTKQDIIDLLTGDVSSGDVAQEARKSGISFQVTASVTNDIRAAGGTDELIRVLRTLAPPAPVVLTNTPHPKSAAAPAVLLIESSPGQSQVYIDDEPVGTTSQQGRLKLTRIAAGDHQVRISLGGYQDYEGSTTLTAGETTTISAALQRAPSPSPPPRPQAEETPTANPGQAGYLGIQPMPQQPAGARGVVISGAVPGGPADQAGLKTYDTILAVNGRQVTTPQELRRALAGHQAGEVVQITWYNGSSNVTQGVRLSAPPAPSPANGSMSFRVAHDHGLNGQDYCVGLMSIGNGVVYYKSDNGVHNFEIPVHSIKEARRNGVYLVGYEAFHIRQKGGMNYNFAALNAQGVHESPDAILNAINSAMGR
ncbi:MAG: PEGA domain-containing protein [Terriglobia bacterium]